MPGAAHCQEAGRKKERDNREKKKEERGKKITTRTEQNKSKE